jgi:hypothetical protein
LPIRRETPPDDSRTDLPANPKQHEQHDEPAQSTTSHDQALRKC